MPSQKTRPVKIDKKTKQISEQAKSSITIKQLKTNQQQRKHAFT